MPVDLILNKNQVLCMTISGTGRTKYQSSVTAGLTATAACLSLFFRYCQHACLAPRVKMATACSRQATTLDSVSHTWSRKPLLTKLGLNIEYNINGEFEK